MGRSVASLVLTLVALAGCTSPLAASSPSPLPSPTPHTPPTSIVLQGGEVPGGLPRCAGSGPIAVYIAGLKGANPDLGRRVAQQWSDLQTAGAVDAAISVFAADASSCTAELGAAANVKAAASLVVAFGDGGQADRAWQAGILGFTPPAPTEQPPGVTRGVSTGLGEASWIYVRAPVQMAIWRKNVFVAVVVFTNLDSASFQAGAAAVNARLT